MSNSPPRPPSGQTTLTYPPFLQKASTPKFFYFEAYSSLRTWRAAGIFPKYLTYKIRCDVPVVCGHPGHHPAFPPDVQKDWNLKTAVRAYSYQKSCRVTSKRHVGWPIGCRIISVWASTQWSTENKISWACRRAFYRKCLGKDRVCPWMSVRNCAEQRNVLWISNAFFFFFFVSPVLKRFSPSRALLVYTGERERERERERGTQWEKLQKMWMEDEWRWESGPPQPLPGIQENCHYYTNNPCEEDCVEFGMKAAQSQGY